MFIVIVRHTPVWVWGLLAALVALGLTQVRDREVGLARVTIVPVVMLALSLSGVLHTFGHAPVAWGGWGAGLAAALVFGRRLVAVPGAAWSERTGRLHVPGSWLPLALFLLMFAAKYFTGVSLALHAGLATDPGFAGSVGLAYGSLSGLLLARAGALRSVARRPGPVQAAWQ